MSIRPHYSDTVVHFFRYGYLLLIPLLQLLMPGADRLNRTVLSQLATACGMILFFDLRRRKSVFQHSGGVLTLRRGIFFRSRIQIDLRRTVLHLKAGPLLRLLGSVKLIPETDMGVHKKPPFSFYMRLDDARALADALGFSAAALRPAARSGLRQAFICAVFSSNSRIGFLALAPLFQAAGRLFEIDPAAPLLGAVSRLEQFLTGFIPPLFTGIAALLIAGYVLSILYLTERNCRFRLYTAPGRFAVAHGALTRITTLLPERALPAVTTRATTLMRACALVQAAAATPNPSVSGGRNVFLLPAAGRGETDALLFPPPGDAVRIPKSTVWRVYLPVIALSGAGCGISLLGGDLFPEIASVLNILALVLCAAAVAAVLPCAVRERQAWVSAEARELCNLRGLSLYRTRLLCPPAAVILRRSPAQRREGLCTLSLRARCGRALELSIAHVPERDWGKYVGPGFTGSPTAAAVPAGSGPIAPTGDGAAPPPDSQSHM